MRKHVKIGVVFVLIICVIFSFFGCSSQSAPDYDSAESNFDDDYYDEESYGDNYYTDLSNYSVDDSVIFGSYPQMQVTDVREIASLDEQYVDMTSYQYDDVTFYYGDFEFEGIKYRKIYWTRDSDEGYPFEKEINYYFYWQPLSWKIIGEEDNEFVLWADYVYDVKPMSFDIDTWDQTYCREWLNYTFLNEAFDEYSQSIINDTDTSGDDYSSVDKIYLLSFDDITNGHYGFKGINTDSVFENQPYDDYNRGTTITEYATFFAPTGEGIYIDDYCDYYLRDLTYGEGYASDDSYYIVEFDDGHVSYKRGYYNCGIRPALRVNKDAKIPNMF